MHIPELHLFKTRGLTNPFLWMNGKSKNVSAVGSLLSSSLLVSVLGDVTSACIKLLSVGITSILHI